MKDMTASIADLPPPREPAWFSKAIADHPARAWVEVDGARIELLTWGARGAPGLLFLHGFRSHADWWSHIAPQFAETHRVAALSWSGMGRSAWRDAYDFPTYVREAMAGATAAGLFDASAEPVVVAHSLGGHVAALLAAEHGARFGRVMLVDSTVGPEPRIPPKDVARRVYRSAEEAMAKFRFTPAQEAEPYIAAWIARNALTPLGDAESPEGWVWRFDPAISAKLARISTWDRLPLARCPLDFIRGARSRLITPEFESLQRRQAPRGSRFVTIPEAGHHLLADQPLSFVAAVRALLA